MRGSLTVCLLAILSSSVIAHAQSGSVDEHKFEAGAQFTVLSSKIPEVIDFSGFVCITSPCPGGAQPIRSARKLQPGLGGRIGYNLTNHVALEAEMNFFPGAGSFKNPSNFSGGHKTQGVFGVRVGKRFHKAGIFAKARPGFIHASKGDLEPIPNTGCIAIFPTPAECFQTISRTSLALDLGAVIEFYPSRRTIIRLDVGDTMIHLGDRLVSGDGPPRFQSLQTPSPTIALVPSETGHNLQLSVGLGFRF